MAGHRRAAATGLAYDGHYCGLFRFGPDGIVSVDEYLDTQQVRRVLLGPDPAVRAS